MELLYFTDISQVQYVLDKKPQLFEQMRPITGDIVVAYELDRLNIGFIDEWDFLEPADIEKNWEIANRLSTSWWDEINANVGYEGFSLFDATKQDMVYPIEACLNAQVVYERIFQENCIDRISGFFLPSIGVIRTGPSPIRRAAMSVSQAVLFWLAEKYNISVNKLETDCPLSQGNWVRKRFPFVNLKTSKSKKTKRLNEKIALVVYEMMTTSEHEALKNTLGKLAEWQVISIAQSDLKQYSIEGQKDFNTEKQLQWAWEEFIKASENYNGLYPEIFTNQHLNFQFKRILDEMATAINHGNVFSTLLDILKPSVVFFGHEAFTIDRVLVRLAQKKNIPTVSFFHGGLGFKFGCRGIVGNSDSILVWNNYDVNILKSYGINESRLNKIGCIRYESELKKYIQKSPDFRKGLKKKLKHRYGISSNNPVIVVITSAINAGFSAPVANPRKHREVLKELLALIKLRKDLHFIIKAHPGNDYYELYRRMQDLNLRNLTFLENATLDEAIEVSDVCLMVNYFTTAALEAMLHRLPVIYLENAIYPLEDWVDNVPGFNLNRVHTVWELENHIDRLITDHVFREQTFTEADNIIHQIFDVNEKSTNERLFDFIKNINTSQQVPNLGSIIVHTISGKQSSNYIGQEEIGNFLNEITLNHSIENNLHAFSFIAGINNLGISSIPKIFDTFQSHFGKENIPSWRESRWPLLSTYISGYNKGVSGGDKYSALCLIGLLLRYPKKHIHSPILIKNDVIKYLVKAIIGNNSVAISVFNKSINSMKKIVSFISA